MVAVCPEPEFAVVVPGELVLAVPELDAVAELEVLETAGELADEALLVAEFELAVGDEAEAAGVLAVVVERLVPPHPARAITSTVEQNTDAQELVCNFGVIYHLGGRFLRWSSCW